MPRARKFGPHMKAGALDLRRYIDEQGISVPDFCEAHGLERVQVQRMLNGERQRVSVEFAADIERATEGAVRVLRWNEPADDGHGSGEHPAVIVPPTGTHSSR
jgi:hypothetical protein